MLNSVAEALVTQDKLRIRDELKAIRKKRFWIVVTSVMAAAVLITAPFFGAPGSAVVVLAAVILISVKKAAVSFVVLGKRRAEVVRSLEAENP